MRSTRHEVTCSICGTVFLLADSTYRNRIKIQPINTKFYCPKCKNIGRSEDKQWRMSQMSDEEKERRRKEASERAKKQWASYDDKRRAEIHEIFKNGQRKYFESLTPEQLEAHKKRMSERSKKMFQNMTEDQCKAFRKFASERSTKMWANMSDEKRNEIRQKQSEGLKRYINSLSDEERQARHQRLTVMYESLSPERQAEVSRKMSIAAKERYENKTEEEKQEWRELIKDGFEKYFDDENKRQEFSIKLIESHKNRSNEQKEDFKRKWYAWWNSLSIEEQKNLSSKRLASAVTNNTLNNKFKERFDNYYQDSQYKAIPEYQCENGKYKHRWDFAIFKNNELICMVDIDGSYFHADDYDDRHSKLQSDEERSFSVPMNVMICIIQERKFDQGFKRLSNMLNMSYQEYVVNLAAEYRAMSFPYPSYTDLELMHSYSELCDMDPKDDYHQSLMINPREGDRLIYHFHHSIWHVRIGEKSPYEAWNDKDSILEMIDDHTLYHSYLNPNKILQSIHINEKYKRIDFMSGAMAKMIIDKYLPEYDLIFDPYASYSGRLLGAISLHKKYLGITNNDDIINESYQLIQLLKKYAVKFDADINKFTEQRIFPCMFTEVANDEMIDYCLETYSCNKYILITKETNKYVANIIDICNDGHIIAIKK